MKVNAFYNIACMGNWRETVLEQFRVLSRAKFPHTIKVTFLGSMDDYLFVEEAAFFANINIVLFHQQCDLMQFEFPSIRGIQKLAQELKGKEPEAVMHFHTKGVSHTHDPGVTFWRWLMNAGVLNRWESCLKALDDHDASGAVWSDRQFNPFFIGNYWMARTDWLAKLDDIDEYRAKRYWGWSDHRGPEYMTRFAVELWISQNVVDGVRPKCSGQFPNELPIWSGDWWHSPEGRDYKVIAFEEGSG